MRKVRGRSIRVRSTPEAPALDLAATPVDPYRGTADPSSHDPYAAHDVGNDPYRDR